MSVKKEKKKVTTPHKWTFQDRPMTIERYNHAPRSITFFGGVYIPTNKESYSVTKVSRVQKNLRQQLWQYLTDNGLDNENYILKIDAPTAPSGSKVYLDLVMAFNAPSVELENNTFICETFMQAMITYMVMNYKLLIRR